MRLDINRAGVGLLPRARHPRASSLVSQPRCSEVLHGGRTWWAHFEFTRINIEPTILQKKIEEQLMLGPSFPFRVRRGLEVSTVPVPDRTGPIGSAYPVAMTWRGSDALTRVAS
jgi:hypothetical protein